MRFSFYPNNNHHHHFSWFSFVVVVALFIIIITIIAPSQVFIQQGRSPLLVEALIVSSTSQFLESSDFAVIAPAETLSYRGETVIGVNSTLGCGHEDPIGVMRPTGYVEANFSSPIVYMYSVGVRAYSSSTLGNTLWLFVFEGSENQWLPAQEVETTVSPTGDLITEQTVCVRLGIAIPGLFGGVGSQHTVRFYPREPGVLLASVNMSMIPPPTILNAYSTCGGYCDPDQPIPIRIETTSICVDTRYNYGNILIRGDGGEYECDARTQRKEPDGTSFIECIIPTNVTRGNAAISASVIWPSSSWMPAAQTNLPIAVQVKEENYLWAIAPAAVGAIVIAIVARYYYKKWAATKNAPREAGNFSAMFVSARRVTLLWEKAPVNTADALKLYDKIVREACDSFNCYIARKIGDSYLIVSKDPVQNIEASGEIQRQLRKVNWYRILTGNDAPADIVAATKSKKKKHQKPNTDRNNNNATNASTAYVSQADVDDGAEGEGDITWSRSSRRSTNGGDSSAGDVRIESLGSSDGENTNNNVVVSRGGQSPTNQANRQHKRMKNNTSSGSLGGAAGSQSKHIRGSTGMGESVTIASMATNSSQRTRNVVETGIQCSIAIARGKGRIQSHEAGTVSEYETFEYSGDVVDEAASMVDLAHAGQVLTLEGVVQAVNGNKDNSSATAAASSVSGTFTTLATKVIKTKSYKFAQYNPAGVEVLGCGLQDESDNIDSIQAQLDVASSGFAQKMCTILYIEFHGLIEQAEAEADDRKSFLEKYKSVYKPINDITKQLGGTLINITSSNLVIAFNAFSPSPMHVTRAATCYFRLRDLFTDEKLKQKFAIGKLAFCAGMSTGNCIVGTLESDKSHKQIFGSTWEQSQELMRMARGYAKAGELTCPCLAIWNSRSDLNHNTQFQFIDLVTSRRSALPNQQQNNQGRILRGIVALMCPSDDNDDDREWMYDLEHQEGNNPYFQTNEAFTWLLGDFIGDAQERWTTILKPKLEKNANNEVAVNQMVGLKRLAEIFAESWEVFSSNVSYNARL